MAFDMTSAGHFFLWVREDEKSGWGFLQKISFDDASQRKSRRRAFTLSTLMRTMRGWRYDYWRYRDADFAIEEQADPYSPFFHVFGTPRIRSLPSGQKPKGRLLRKIPSWKVGRPPKKRRAVKKVKAKSKPKRKSK